MLLELTRPLMTPGERWNSQTRSPRRGNRTQAWDVGSSALAKFEPVCDKPIALEAPIEAFGRAKISAQTSLVTFQTQSRRI